MAALRTLKKPSSRECSFFTSLVNEKISEIELLLDKRASAASLLSMADSIDEAIPWSKCVCDIKCTGLCFLHVSTCQSIIHGEVLLRAAICCQNELQLPLDAIRYAWPLFSPSSTWEIGSVLGRSFIQLRLWNHAYDVWKMQCTNQDAVDSLGILRKAESHNYLAYCYKNMGNVSASKNQLDLSINFISRLLVKKEDEYFDIALIMDHYLRVIKGESPTTLQNQFSIIQQTVSKMDVGYMTQKTGLELSKYCSLLCSIPSTPSMEELAYVEWLESSFDYFGERKPTKSIQSLASSGMVLQSKKHGKKVGLKLGKFVNPPISEGEKKSVHRVVGSFSVKGFIPGGKLFRSQSLLPKKQNTITTGASECHARHHSVSNDDSYDLADNFIASDEDFADDVHHRKFDINVGSKIFSNPSKDAFHDMDTELNSCKTLTAFTVKKRNKERIAFNGRTNIKLHHPTIILSDEESQHEWHCDLFPEAIHRHSPTDGIDDQLSRKIPIASATGLDTSTTSMQPQGTSFPSTVVKIRWEDASRRLVSIPLSSTQISSMNVGDLISLLADAQKVSSMSLCLADGSELLSSTDLSLVLSLPESTILTIHERPSIPHEHTFNSRKSNFDDDNIATLPKISCASSISEQKIAKKYEALCLSLNFPFVPKIYDALERMTDTIIFHGEAFFGELLVGNSEVSIVPVLAALKDESDLDLIKISDFRLEFCPDVKKISCKRLSLSRCMLATELKILSCFDMSCVLSLDLSYNLITDDGLFPFLCNNITNGKFSILLVKGNSLEGLSFLNEWSHFVANTTTSFTYLDLSYNDKLSPLGLLNLLWPFRESTRSLDRIAIGPLFGEFETCDDQLVRDLSNILMSSISQIEIQGPFPRPILKMLLSGLLAQNTALNSLSLINCGLTTELAWPNSPSYLSKKCILRISGNPGISSYNMLTVANMDWEFIAFDRCGLDVEGALMVLHALNGRCKYLSLCWNSTMIRNVGDFRAILDGISCRKSFTLDLSFSFVSREVFIWPLDLFRLLTKFDLCYWMFLKHHLHMPPFPWKLLTFRTFLYAVHN